MSWRVRGEGFNLVLCFLNRESRVGVRSVISGLVVGEEGGGILEQFMCM